MHFQVFGLYRKARQILKESRITRAGSCSQTQGVLNKIRYLDVETFIAQ